MSEIPRLSATVADRLLRKGARACWARHRLLGGMQKPSTTSQIEGRMWHAALLEESHDVVGLDFGDFKTAAAREARDEVLSEGKLPTTKDKLEALKPACIRIQESMAEYGLYLDGDKEVRIEWEEYAGSDKNETVHCSGYIDQCKPHQILDLKSQKTEPTFGEAIRHIESGHSLLQQPAYSEGAWQTFDGSNEPEMIEFIYVFFQTEEPFEVLPVTLDGSFRELAMIRWRRAVEQWNQCMTGGTESKYWPHLADSITPISAPGYALNRELELEAMESG